MLTKLVSKTDGEYISNKKSFNAMSTLKPATIEKTLDFAYEMTFGSGGEHRNHRSGGSHVRKNGEIFANTFQGKLSEFAIYNTFYRDFDVPEPDLQTYALGEWDDADFIINTKKISVKSTKSFGNLLLLETKDWNKDGKYIPNLSKESADYDIFILVRLAPYCEDLFRKNRILYSETINKDKLKELILNETWEYDIPGFVSKEQLVYAINNNFVIEKGAMLNGKTKMDAQNYYIQSGDMYNISELKNLLIPKER